MKKISQKSTTALLLAILVGGTVAIGFELLFEVNPVFNNIDRTYKLGLWASDFAMAVGVFAGIWGGLWGWKSSDDFRDLIIIDFFDWIRDLFKSR